MLRNIVHFFNTANATIERSSAAAAGDGTKITYNTIKAKLGPLLYKLSSQKFEDPADGESRVRGNLQARPSLPLCLPRAFFIGF